MTTPTLPVRRLGGPAAIEVTPFTQARTTELAALRTAIQTGRGNRRVHQQLSWHMRRRTLSHSSRRAPASIRAAHQRELSVAGIKERAPGPRGSRRLRKYRARARFLQSMRKLRNARPSRLETHEWHAKRFHMTPLPGHPARVVAHHCNDRGLRSAFRACSHSSAAHDASYIDIVSIVAPTHAQLIGALAHVMDPVDAARVSASHIASGLRSALGAVVLDPVTKRVIAPVDVLFRPCSGGEDSHPSVWLWAHPVASQPIVDALRSSSSSKATISLLRNELQTLRVIGPRAGFVIGAVIQRTDTPTPAWDLVRHARSPASSPAHSVLAGVMLDPRANFPPKRVQAMAMAAADERSVRALADASASAFANLPPESAIWSETARNACTPRGSGTDVQNIPFLLLQRPGQGRGLGAGWDIVVPKGWGRPLWHSIMYANGARALGLVEMKHIALETSEVSFPADFLDSAYANLAFREVEKTLSERFERRPKSKRVNYGLYRVHSPFYPDLAAVGSPVGSDAVKACDANSDVKSKGETKVLDGNKSENEEKSKAVARRPRKRRRFALAQEVPASEQMVALAQEKISFRIVRNRTELREKLGLLPTSVRFTQRPLADAESGGDKCPQLTEDAPADCEQQCFARALIEPVGRGTVVMNALICAPSDEDLKQAGSGNLKHASMEKLRREGDERASRDCIGRVIHGDFCMSRAAPAAIAFVKIDDVRRLLTDGRAVPQRRRGGDYRVQVRVLVRNIDSLQYRFGIATINV